MFDLSVPLDDTLDNIESAAAAGSSSAALSGSMRLTFDGASKRLDALLQLGYDGAATNYVVVGKLQPKDTFVPSSVAKSSSVQESFLKATGKPGFHVFSRITVVLDGTGTPQINSNNPVLNSYDIVAVRPLTDKTFQASCITHEVDIISIDLSERLPFSLKRGSLHSAIQRGVYFEICYSKAIKNANSRKSLISNAINLIRLCKGKNIVISSSALTVMDLRGPYDVINMACLFGLNQADAKACLTVNARAVLFHGETRRSTFKAVLSVEGASILAAQPKQQPQQGKSKRQLEEVSTTVHPDSKKRLAEQMIIE